MSRLPRRHPFSDELPTFLNGNAEGAAYGCGMQLNVKVEQGTIEDFVQALEMVLWKATMSFKPEILRDSNTYSFCDFCRAQFQSFAAILEERRMIDGF